MNTLNPVAFSYEIKLKPHIALSERFTIERPEGEESRCFVDKLSRQVSELSTDMKFPAWQKNKNNEKAKKREQNEVVG